MGRKESNQTNKTKQNKVLDKKYLLKLDNVSQTSSKNDSPELHQFVSGCLSYVPFLCLKLYSLNFAIAYAQKDCFAYQKLDILM